jgi:threonyl-tRNA synthetase
MKNVFGKEDTLFTVQIDFQQAEMFGMTYVDSDGEKKYPIIIHRSSIGCYERTLALLIEKYAGAFPLWLAPVQAIVLPLTDRNANAAKDVYDTLKLRGFRMELDNRNEKIGYKIRSAQNQKIPYMLVIGDKEQENGMVAARCRREGDLGAMKVDEFAKLMNEKIDDKT